MVFNWFRRQFGSKEGTSQESKPENQSQVEEEQKAPAESAESEPTEESATTVDDDYLSWAKAAYKNIQQQEPSPETTTPTPTESPETTSTEESTAAETELSTPQAVVATDTEEVEDTVASTDTSEETTTTETPATEEIVATVTEISQLQLEAATTETTEIITEEKPVSELVTQEDTTPGKTELADQKQETTLPEPEVTAVTSQEEAPELPAPDSSDESLPEEDLDTLPVAKTEVDATDATQPTAVEPESTPAAPVPIWARKSAEREARLERLKATAIETPQPEFVQTAAQQEKAEVPDIAFDEEFVWSSQVLAAQGRSPEEVSVEEISWLKQLRQGLSKTRLSLVNQLKAVVGQGPLNQDAIMEIEALLLQADVGVEATDYVIETLQAKMREEVLPPEEAIAYLKKILRDLLESPYSNSYNPTFAPEQDTFNIWLMTGVNGAGKTTTIGKLAHLAKKSGYSCLIAAADTFRAAAVEQVKIWGERSGTEVIANPGKNTDPAAVVFDAITAAKARNAQLLLVDTAGRLQNKKNLMEELAKIRRIVDKKASDAQVESLLVLDATLGQNGLRQAQVFSEAAKLSGVVLTKLDGTAKGGVALAVVQQLGLPIRFIGAGEGIEDLRPFSSYEFVEALLSG
ncbi:MAG: signal recognition particle-docking protein FtsY [Symploca sp. SIO2C1]|nr:signal recognition particle-docking protein FtsY [Symploca sp. SIO2C1]